MDDRIERLACAFVECTTEFDYAPLPEHVKGELRRAVEVFLKHVDPFTVQVGETKRTLAING